MSQPPTPMASKVDQNLPIAQTYFNDRVAYYANGNINSYVYVDSNDNLVLRPDAQTLSSGTLSLSSIVTTPQPPIVSTRINIIPSTNTTVSGPIVSTSKVLNFTGNQTVEIDPSYVGCTTIINITASNAVNCGIQLNSNQVQGEYYPGDSMKFVFNTVTNSDSSFSISNGPDQVMDDSKVNPESPYLKYVNIFTPDGIQWYQLENNITPNA